MQVVLIMFRNGGDRRSFSVVRSTTTIGRREDCDLRIPVGDVSRKHCRLVLTADNVRIQDLGSSNGTYVNGQRVSDAFLNPGDTVGVGPVHFVVQIDGVPSEDDLAAPTPTLADSALGGTALAADALAAGQAAEFAPADDVVEDDGLLEEIGDPSAEPEASPSVLSDELTIDEEPAAAAASSADVAFDLTDDTEPAAAETPPAAPAAAAPAAPGADADWDFLLEEPEAARSNTDMHVDLDSQHGHSQP